MATLQEPHQPHLGVSVCYVLCLLFKKGSPLSSTKDLFSGDLKCLPLYRQTDVTFVQPSLQEKSPGPLLQTLLSSPLI